MDYLDELDSSAIQALTELGGSFDLRVAPGATATSSRAPHPARRRGIQVSYLLRLEHPLSTPRDVANAPGLSRVPAIESGIGEAGDVSFCRLDQDGIDKLDAWAARSYPRKKFTKIRVGMTHKENGDLPLLGRDPTLPQHRPSTTTSAGKGQCPEYPMYFFFYGTLADPARLSRLFDVPMSTLPSLCPATLLDGRLQRWMDKYPALVDSPEGRVKGWLYPVKSAEHEEALRRYEGDSYEVVEARVYLEDETVGQNIEKRVLLRRARTFRFSGFDDELNR